MRWRRNLSCFELSLASLRQWPRCGCGLACGAQRCGVVRLLTLLALLACMTWLAEMRAVRPIILLGDHCWLPGKLACQHKGSDVFNKWTGWLQEADIPYELADDWWWVPGGGWVGGGRCSRAVARPVLQLPGLWQAAPRQCMPVSQAPASGDDAWATAAHMGEQVKSRMLSKRVCAGSWMTQSHCGSAPTKRAQVSMWACAHAHGVHAGTLGCR